MGCFLSLFFVCLFLIYFFPPKMTKTSKPKTINCGWPLDVLRKIPRNFHSVVGLRTVKISINSRECSIFTLTDENNSVQCFSFADYGLKYTIKLPPSNFKYKFDHILLDVNGLDESDHCLYIEKTICLFLRLASEALKNVKHMKL